MKNTTEDFLAYIGLASSELAKYVEKSRNGETVALDQREPKEIARSMQMENWIRKGGMDEDQFTDLLKKYLSFSQHMHHPHYIGHQVAVPHLSAGVADLIHGVINNPMAIYEMGPAAATMEKVVINWMLEKIGWSKAKNLYVDNNNDIGGGGVLTHGGSLANLTSMLAARAKIAPESWTEGVSNKLVVLVPESSHYSIARSVSIMGLGNNNLILLPTNNQEQIISSKVKKIIDDQKKEGKKIMALAANACATSTGLYDPLDELGDICQEENVWLHVDGAHGAGALLWEEGRELMKGIHKADSMIWDAHKMLRTSALSAAVLFKDHNNLERTFRQKGDYLISEEEKIGYDFMFHTVECTKSGLGPKIFWTLASMGEKEMADYISNQYSKTRKFYDLINAQNDFECPYVPQSNILCFKYTGKDISDKQQLRLREKLTENGNFYITSTTVNQIRYLRITVMNDLTDNEHIHALLDELRVLADTL